MLASNLALAIALAGVQPACDPRSDCLPAADETAAAQDAVAQESAPEQVEGSQAPAQPPVESPEADEAAKPPEGAEQAAAPPKPGEIVVTGEIGAKPQGDPAEALNAATYEVVQKVDEAVVEPLAVAYDKGIPTPIRKGLRNVLRNLGEPINFLNFLLQFKPGKALKSLGRFTINTTLGLAGLMDPASKKPFNLKRETNGLANTLAYYGVGPGPYLFLPFIGPTTVRDLFGRIVDLSIIPAVVGKPFDKPLYAISVGALSSLESRLEIDADINAIRERCGDPYSGTRDIYLIQRQIEIARLRGRASERLPQLIERLQFNCDIKILTEGAVGGSVIDHSTATGATDAPADAQPTVEPAGDQVPADGQAEPSPEQPEQPVSPQEALPESSGQAPPTDSGEPVPLNLAA